MQHDNLPDISAVEAQWADFELHYQPLIDTSRHTLIGYETLIRLRDADGPLLYPMDFLSSLKASGMIAELGAWVIAQALWDHSHLPAGFITINLSASELATLNIERLLLQESARSGIELKRVMLEITEEALVYATEEVVDMLERIRSLGVMIAIDDFGTGYSSLARLLEIPCDVVKLDRLFIQHAAQSAKAWRLFRAVVNLCKEVGMMVIAEGVESDTHVRLAHESGCDGMQGYRFGEALAFDAIGKDVPQTMQRVSANKG